MKKFAKFFGFLRRGDSDWFASRVEDYIRNPSKHADFVTDNPAGAILSRGNVTMSFRKELGSDVAMYQERSHVI